MAKEQKKEEATPAVVATDLSHYTTPELMGLHYVLVNEPEKKQEVTLQAVEREIHNRTRLV